eukprot:Gb_13732 [translate_table: standard]
MRNDAGSQARGRRTGRNGSSFFPSSFRVISSYLKSVSTNASTIASNVRSAGASVASSISHTEDEREQVQWAGFDKLELAETNVRRVLLLSYLNGFQVLDVEEADNVRELVSKRDGPVTFLQMQPRPITSDASDGGFIVAQPLLLIVTGDGTVNGGIGQGGFGVGYSRDVGSPPQALSNNFVPTMVRFYSLRSHSYVHALRFRSAIYVVRCSPRIVAVALAAQIYCFDAASLQNIFSVLTYPIPQGNQVSGGVNIGYGPMAVGSRWLAYAANHALVSNTGRVSPQHLTPSPGVSPSTSPANGSLVAHYAKESSKQIAAGIVTLGDMGYKTLSRYYHDLLPDGASSTGSASTSWKNNKNSLAAHACEPDYAGTVIVRDFVSKVVVAQFRAHASPLSALCFDPSGTLLVTASVHGHNLNVFRIMPSTAVNGSISAGYDWNTSYVHLYKLSRGLTNAVIQDISFSDYSQWIAISSSRGTCHLFAISPFGGVVGPHTHGGTTTASALPIAALPWWSSLGMWRVNQQTLPPPPPPITLSVVSRIKNSNGGWLNTVSGAAAAATGRTNSPSGAVAVVFHNGGGHNVQSDIGNFRDQLWVFSPSGHVIQHTLRPSNGAETDYCTNISSGMGNGSCGQGQARELRVVVEPIQWWDVCRMPNQLEREEDIENFSVARTANEANHGNGTILACSAVRRNSVKDGITTEEKRCFYLSNAEVQVHIGRPSIWEKSEIYFHVMMSAAANGKCNDKDELGGEIEIEKFTTREVEVRRKDLVPVFEHLQISKDSQVARDTPSERLSATSELQIHQLKHGSTQDALIGMNVGCVQIQHSSSGSNCGYEGNCFGGQTMVLNGFHHSHQDSQEQMEGVFFSNSMSASRNPPTSAISSERALIPGSLSSLKLTNHSLSIKSTAQIATHKTASSPPIDVPRWSSGNACNMQVFENFHMVDGGAKSIPMHDCGFIEKDAIADDATGSGVVNCKRHVTDGQLSRDSSSSNQGLSFDDNLDTFGPNLCHVGAESETNSLSSELHDAHILRGGFCEERRHCATNGDIQEGFQLQDENGTINHAEISVMHSKSGDTEEAEYGEDAWEGGMFPFCEEE